MLVLSRRIGEQIVIGDGIVVTVVAVDGNKVRLGVAAPRAVRVDRAEIALERDGAAAPGRADRRAVLEVA